MSTMGWLILLAYYVGVGFFLTGVAREIVRKMR